MDPEAEIKKQVNPFYCNIEEALKAHSIVKTASGSGEQVETPVKLPDYVQTEPERFHGQTLEEQLNMCKDSEPALGLSYTVEYQSKDSFPFPYECKLCHCKTELSNMFMHVCGSKHRMSYLKQHYPDIAESDEVKGKGSELKRKVRQVALTIEKKEGRKQVKQSFEILNEDDASFILKVTQILTEALVEYCQQAASNKNLLGIEYNGAAVLEYFTGHSDLTSTDINDSDTDYSSSQSAKQYLTVNEEENFLTGSSETAYENNITAEFLNSVRNMNVEDVTATLHKIAAANPAFRGIDIPDVLRILTESGTLRRPSNGSTQ